MVSSRERPSFSNRNPERSARQLLTVPICEQQAKPSELQTTLNDLLDRQPGANLAFLNSHSAPQELERLICDRSYKIGDRLELPPS
ncbi:MAG: hypothetical protein HC890_10565 [Chloroflexaceae bacterium]|nr:hypothetical protein [Chloroflexaceae bacterium]